MVNSPNLTRREVPMSTLVMPVDVEFYSLGTSPVLSSSPMLGADFLSELHCSTLSWRDHEQRSNLFNQRLSFRDPPPPPPSSSDLRRSPSAGDDLAERVSNMDISAPRSILVDRENGAQTEAPAGRDKKRVVFADDRGLDLVQVVECSSDTEQEQVCVPNRAATRLMTEPSHMPPRWTARFLQKVTGFAPAAPSRSKRARWVVSFPQPVANYTQFCDKLDSASIALENTQYKEPENKLAGVIKVKNLHFEKRVFVRVTFDNWKSYRDCEAVYIAPPSAGGHALYDRFSFEFDLPEATSTTSRVEFCLGFQCPVGEFWDNNDGRNYCLVREKSQVHTQPVHDTYRAQVDNWSSFASWNDRGDVPYW